MSLNLEYKRQKMNQSPRNKTLAVPFIIITVFMAGLLFLTIQLDIRRARISSYEEAEQILTENSLAQTSEFQTTLSGQYSVLDLLSSEIALQKNINTEEVLRYTNIATQRTSFLHIVLDLPDGSATMNNGTKTNVSDRKYFIQAMKGVRSIECIEDAKIESGRRVILAVPIIKGNTVVGVLHGSYSESLLRTLLVSNVYNRSSYTFLCDSDGKIIVGSDSESFSSEGDNLFNIIKTEGDHEAELLSKVRDDLQNGVGGTISYTTDIGKRFAVYTPLNLTDSGQKRWYIVNAIPNEVLMKSVSKIVGNGLLTNLLVPGMMIISILIIIFLERRNNLQRDKEMEKISISEQLYRIAMAQSNKEIIRFDFATKISYRENSDDDSFGTPRVIHNFPESVLKLHSEKSRMDYMIFIEKIRSGEPSATVVSYMKDTKGSWRWIRSDATTIFDKSGKPVQAIITYYDVTDQREKEIVNEKWKHELSAIPKDSSTIFECNLTRDFTENVQGDLLKPIEESESVSFNERTRIRSKLVVPEDREAFIKFMNRERLIASFYDGVYAHTMDYRISRDGKTARWTNITVQLAQYPDTNDIKAFLIVRDIDAEKQTGLRLQLDPLTSVLNRAAFTEKVIERLKTNSDTGHALILLDIDNFKAINDSFGHQEGDHVLERLTEELRSTMREKDLIGRVGGDEFMILISNLPDPAIEKLSSDICSRLKHSSENDIHVSVSLGVSLFPRDGKTFEELYHCADIAMYRVKKDGRNGYNMYSGKSDFAG